MIGALTGIAPLTLTLSPEGRGDAGGGAGAPIRDPAASPSTCIEVPSSPRPVGERVRVRGQRAQPAQVQRARTLRRVPTEAENRLWYHLRNRRLAGFKFVRQLPIAGYYADFACRDAMLVIEADGGQHALGRDRVRDAAIRSAGYTILRFWNNDILSDTDTVLATILHTLRSLVSSPFRGEGEGEGCFHLHKACE